ncbi:hypothetical protein FA95DRAFT_1353920 [Auriscalpium vulgare]|uniref:Uncharacterized protein n=1 Tax=Auriscalpium vulgare TaxID=40419 RepID=A0ACB8R1H5_9AGAM|nr:hypothetical protein FA95DRAFT_1353920 [Auriscalpium vulgare]
MYELAASPAIVRCCIAGWTAGTVNKGCFESVTNHRTTQPREQECSLDSRSPLSTARRLACRLSSRRLACRLSSRTCHRVIWRRRPTSWYARSHRGANRSQTASYSDQIPSAASTKRTRFEMAHRRSVQRAVCACLDRMESCIVLLVAYVHRGSAPAQARHDWNTHPRTSAPLRLRVQRRRGLRAVPGCG